MNYFRFYSCAERIVRPYCRRTQHVCSSSCTITRPSVFFIALMVQESPLTYHVSFITWLEKSCTADPLPRSCSIRRTKLFFQRVPGVVFLLSSNPATCHDLSLLLLSTIFKQCVLGIVDHSSVVVRTHRILLYAHMMQVSLNTPCPQSSSVRLKVSCPGCRLIQALRS